MVLLLLLSTLYSVYALVEFDLDQTFVALISPNILGISN